MARGPKGRSGIRCLLLGTPPAYPSCPLRHLTPLDRSPNWPKSRLGELDPVHRPARAAVPHANARTGPEHIPIWIVSSRPRRCRTSRASPSGRLRASIAQEGVDLHPNGLNEQPAGTDAQHFGQGIVDVLGLTKPDDVGRCLHKRVALDARFCRA